MKRSSPPGSTRSTGGSRARWRRTIPGCWRSSRVSAPLAGRRVLDLGCGKGRFSGRLSDAGRTVVGLDLSAAMLAEATGIDRVRASARRLPFGPASFDGVVAVEVFEHLAPRVARPGLRRSSPRAPAGRDVRHRRQERLLVECPAALAAERGREVDRRAPRSLDVFPPRAGARALVPARGVAAAARAVVSRRSGSNHLLSRAERGPVSVSVRCPARDCSCSGRPGRREAPRDRTLFADAGVAAAPLVEDAAGPGADPRPGRGGVRDGQGRSSALVPRRPVRPVRRPRGLRRLAARPAEPGPRRDRRRRPAAWRAGRSVRGPGRPTSGARLVGRRPVDAFRAGGAIAQGVDSPPADRQLARGSHRRRAASGSGWPRFRTRIARPSASGPTSTSRCPKTTIASPRPGRPWTAAARISSAPTPTPIIRRSSTT